MKNVILKTLFVVVAVFVSITSQAQDEEYKTIFGNDERIKVSGFGGIITELSISPTSDKIGTFYSVGGEGAVLFNQKFYVGLFGMSSVAPLDIRKPSANLNTDELMFVQTGVSVGYKFQPFRAIHVSMGLRTGYGHIQEFNRNSVGSWDDDYNYTRYASTFVATPHVSIEANFFPWMKVSLGAGYRQTFGNENRLEVSPSKDLSQPILQTGVSFGWFKPKNKKTF